MKRRNNTSLSQRTIFPLSSSNGPIENLLSLAGNIIVGAGAEWLSREFRDAIGLPTTTTQSQIELTRGKMQLAKQEADNIHSKVMSEKEAKI